MLQTRTVSVTCSTVNSRYSVREIDSELPIQWIHFSFNCDGDNYVIRREISRGRDNKVSSNWWVNGRAANLKSVSCDLKKKII